MTDSKSSLFLSDSAPLTAFLLFVGMIALIEFGRRRGKRRTQMEGATAREGLGAVEGAVFALMGLLVAFTFSGAATRFEGRREMVVEEANAVGTAWLRLDLLPADCQPALRDRFRSYLDARLAAYQALPDMDAAWAKLAEAAGLQTEIWNQAVGACRSSGDQRAGMLLLPALNAMFDITTVRTMATESHPPFVVFIMLFLMALSSALLAGYGMAGSRSHSWIHIIGFAAILAFTVFAIIDLEYPRTGLIRVDAVDQLLVSLRASMN